MSLVTTNLCCLPIAYAQRSFTSFGPYADFSLGYTPAALSVSAATPSVRARIAILQEHRNQIRFYAVNDSGAILETGSTQTAKPQQYIVPMDVDGNGETAYITLSAEGGEVSVLKKKGSSFEEHRMRIDGEPQRCIIADVNNDGKKDILLFGKSMAGVATLLGRGGGVFVPGPTFFPEISASDLTTADLNGDGIADILLLNWLSNRMVLFFGISGGVYSEQVTVDLPGEPSDMAIVRGFRRRGLRVAVTLPDARQVLVFTVNAAGEFELDQQIQCPGRPAGLQFARLNNDALPDLVTVTDRGVVVALAASAVEFAPPTVFGIGTTAASWQVTDVDGDGHNDIVVGDRATRSLQIAVNADHSGSVRWRDEYVVGEGPVGLALCDLNNDGAVDIAAANSLSGTISLLLNKGNGRMNGQQSVAVSERPSQISTVTGETHPGRTLVVTHPSVDKFSVVTLAPDLSRSASFAVPTASHPYVLRALDDRANRKLRVLVRSTPPRTSSVSLSLFEQISRQQFVERRFRPTLPENLSALTIGGIVGQMAGDLLFVMHDRATKQTTVFLSPGLTGFDFKSVRPLFAYPAPTSRTHAIVSADIDGDGLNDLLMVLAPPAGSCVVAFGNGDGTFREDLVWIPDVHPAHPDNIILRDVDGDGKPDMTYVDAHKRAVVTLFGVGGGRFASPAIIFPATEASEIAVGSLRSPEAQDLVISHRERGTISILYDPFRLKKP